MLSTEIMQQFSISTRLMPWRLFSPEKVLL